MKLNEFPSQLLRNAVEELASLPGIGRKTALRLTLHLLRRPRAEVAGFAEALTRLRNEVKHCIHCQSLSDGPVCAICADGGRDQTLLCVVESVRDVMSIEATGQYNGRYYVLGGLISPMDGVGPDDIRVEGLVNKIGEGHVQEVIMALSATMEGDTTSYYIYRKIPPGAVVFSVIARGVAFGDDLEYADEITLGRAIASRTKLEAAPAN